MASEIRHSLLASGLLEARAYQLEAVDETLSGSTLLVLPTAAGKTAVAWMVMAEMLRRTDGWALMIAPTVALVKQHHDGLVEAFSGQGIEAVAMSGAIPAAKRQSMWGRSRLVVSTPRSEERRVGKECRSRWSPDH